MLKAQLKSRYCIRLMREDLLQVLGGLKERTDLRAGTGRLLPVQAHPHRIKTASQAIPQFVERLHREERAERFHRGFQSSASYKAAEQAGQQHRPDAVPRQHLREIQRYGASAPAALAAVGAVGALAAGALRVCLVGIVAQNDAVAVQRAALAAVGAALLLERKSSLFNAGSSRTNRTQEGGMRRLMPERIPWSRAFSQRRD
jgi:hypothetical protein